LLADEIETLAKERQRLVAAKATLQEEIEDDIGSLDEELINLKEGWAEYSFKKRRSLLNFAILSVTINKVSTHWIEIQVHWLNEAWGVERMYFKRKYGALKDWTNEEEEILLQHYATMPTIELLRLVPDRSLWSIRSFVKANPHIPRRLKQVNGCINPNVSYNDMQFTQTAQIGVNESYTNWERPH